MADIELVIKIPEEYYNDICNSETVNNYSVLYALDVIRNGVVLPKGHGRIGDLDQILIWMIYKKGIIDKLKCGEITPVFKDATIIEADTESEEV